MSQVACPRCDENIRLPAATPPPDASARCPWCRETYSFHELEDRLPPMLQWVGSDGETIPYSAGTLTGSAAEADAAEYSHSDGNAYTVDDSPGDNRLEDDFEPDEVHFSDSAAPVAASASFDSSSPRTHSRPRKSPSALKTMIQMVLGGAVAIPLTGLILFAIQWMGWKTFNFGFWPFDGSGGASRRTAAVPMEVPDRPQPQPSSRELGDGSLPFGANGESPQAEDEFIPRSASAAPDTIEELSQPPADAPPLSVPELDPDTATDEMTELAIPEPTLDVPNPFAQPSDAAVETSPEPSSDEIDNPAVMELPAPSEASSEPNGEPSELLEPPSLELLDAIENARKRSTDLAQASGDQPRGELLKNFYYALAEVGEHGQPSAGAAYKSLFAQLREAEQIDDMAKFGSPWVAKGNLVHKGVFATGTLEQQDDQLVLVMTPTQSLPLEGWQENQIDPESWIGKNVVVLAKLEGPIGSREGTVRYLEER